MSLEKIEPVEAKKPVIRWTRPVLAGCLVQGVLLLLGGAGVISWFPVMTVTVFAGGLVAGLLRGGPGWRGALAGIPAGVIVAAGSAIRSLADPPGASGNWNAALLSLVFTAVFFVPTNAISGATGSVARRIGQRLAPPAALPTGPGRTALWRPWAGILAGALLIPLPVFASGSLSLLLVIPPFAGGLAAGFFTGGIRRGAESGFLAWVLGIGILAVPVIWISSRSTGFTAGLGGIVLIVMACLSLPAEVAGGAIGGYAGERILRGRRSENA